MLHLPHPVRSASFASPFAAMACALLALTGCAAGQANPPANSPASPKPQANHVELTHNCKPQETVGFSCEMHDRRLLSLCGSTDFLSFKGAPKDNPGYAYLVVGNAKGETQYSYPPNPYDYKQRMYKGYPTNGIPYMQVSSEKGPFFFLGAQDDTSPAGAGTLEPKNLPAGWRIDQQRVASPCGRLLNFDHLEAVSGKLLFQGHWSMMERARQEAESAKARLP